MSFHQEQTNQQIEITSELILEIDSCINEYIDSHRKSSLIEIIQGVLKCIKKQSPLELVWIQYQNSRNFIDSISSQEISFSEGIDSSLMKEIERRTQLFSSHEISIHSDKEKVPPFSFHWDSLFIYAVPMFAGTSNIFLGLVGAIFSQEISPKQIKLLTSVSKRVDTLINFKNLANEHHVAIKLANEYLDQEGLHGIEQALTLLQKLLRVPKAVILYLDEPLNINQPANERTVNIIYSQDGKIIDPPNKNYLLKEGLAGNLIEYEGDIRISKKALASLGIIDKYNGPPSLYEHTSLRNRTNSSHHVIGKLFLIGGEKLDQSDLDIMETIAMQIDTKILNYHDKKINLLKSLNYEQVDFFIHHPKIANWFFEKPREEEIAMVYSDICGYTALTRRLKDPSLTITGAKKWILKEIELTAKHGGYFDKEIGDCAVSLFGPPFYELSLELLLSVKKPENLEQLMRENPPDPERYAYHAVLYALENMELISNFEIGGHHLNLSIGIEVERVAIGDLNGNLGSLTAMGEGMNLASRLQGVGEEGEIVIGPNCYHRLMGYLNNNLAKKFPFKIKKGGEAKLKGYDHPVSYYLVFR